MKKLAMIVACMAFLCGCEERTEFSKRTIITIDYPRVTLNPYYLGGIEKIIYLEEDSCTMDVVKQSYKLRTGHVYMFYWKRSFGRRILYRIEETK